MNSLIQPNRSGAVATSLCRGVFILCCFSLCSTIQAVSPPPDGGYSGGNTAEGTNALLSLTTGVNNTALGFNALFHNTTGYYNTASGYQALYSNSTGFKNTADGFRALYLNTTGHENTAEGLQALYNNTTGFDNTAIGLDALFHNTNGDSSTAIGYLALFNNTTGTRNTATGFEALANNTEGGDNTATGYRALFHNTVGIVKGVNNTATGSQALYSNSFGQNNTATGGRTLYSNTSGTDNTATGHDALLSNISGSENVANGWLALLNNTSGDVNTACGAIALSDNTTGSSNIALGVGAGANLTTGDDNIDIGNEGIAAESSTIRIGDMQTRTFVAGIYNVNEGGTILPVYINSNGQLGTMSSSRRFKEEIKPMDKASEAIFALRPMTFRYKKEIDPDGIPQFGLVAEEVEKVNPDLVVRDAEGKAYTVRYDAVNAMLLNEFLKEHRKNEVQQGTIDDLRFNMAKQQATIERQQKQIDALAAGLQKVSGQLDVHSSSQLALRKAALETDFNIH